MDVDLRCQLYRWAEKLEPYLVGGVLFGLISFGYFLAWGGAAPIWILMTIFGAVGTLGLTWGFSDFLGLFHRALFGRDALKVVDHSTPVRSTCLRLLCGGAGGVVLGFLAFLLVRAN